MNELRLDLADGRRAFTPGESLTGRAVWRVDEALTSAELRVFWYTSGKGTQDVGIVRTMALEAPRLDDEREFSVVLPREPFSFSGTLISLTWAIELILEPGGRVARHEFVLSATGREVVLGDEGA